MTMAVIVLYPSPLPCLDTITDLLRGVGVTIWWTVHCPCPCQTVTRTFDRKDDVDGVETTDDLDVIAMGSFDLLLVGDAFVVPFVGLKSAFFSIQIGGCISRSFLGRIAALAFPLVPFDLFCSNFAAKAPDTLRGANHGRVRPLAVGRPRGSKSSSCTDAALALLPELPRLKLLLLSAEALLVYRFQIFRNVRSSRLPVDKRSSFSSALLVLLCKRLSSFLEFVYRWSGAGRGLRGGWCHRSVVRLTSTLRCLPIER